MIPKGSFIEVNDGFKFHYYDEGDGNVVLLLHGSGTGASGHTNFKNNFIALRDAGFRVILPDLPGYGFSSKPDNEIYSLQYFNKKIIEFVDDEIERLQQKVAEKHGYTLVDHKLEL